MRCELVCSDVLCCSLTICGNVIIEIYVYSTIQQNLFTYYVVRLNVALDKSAG